MYEVLTPEDAVKRVLDAGDGGVLLNPLVGGAPRDVAEPYFYSFIDGVLPLVTAARR